MNGLLENVQVQDEAVGRDHPHRAPALFDAIAVIQLNGAKISQQQNIRRYFSHLKGVCNGRLFDGHALRADTHTQSQLLSGGGEV